MNESIKVYEIEYTSNGILEKYIGLIDEVLQDLRAKGYTDDVNIIYDLIDDLHDGNNNASFGCWKLIK